MNNLFLSVSVLLSIDIFHVKLLLFEIFRFMDIAMATKSPYWKLNYDLTLKHTSIHRHILPRMAGFKIKITEIIQTWTLSIF